MAVLLVGLGAARELLPLELLLPPPLGIVI